MGNLFFIIPLKVIMSIIYNYNKQIVPPGPLINVTVESSDNPEIFISTPALIDTGADYTVITREIFKKLAPLRVGLVYVESFRGEGDFHKLYSVNIKIHNWEFYLIPVLVGSENYVILGRDLLNNFDLRLNGIDGKLKILRCIQK